LDLFFQRLSLVVRGFLNQLTNITGFLQGVAYKVIILATHTV